MSDVGFAYSSRWWQLGAVAPDETVTRLEERDRELEQFLDAPAQRMASPRMVLYPAPYTDVTSLIGDFTVRWERQRGQWVALEAQGHALGTTLSPASGQAAIVLPAEAAPYLPALGRAATLGGYFRKGGGTSSPGLVAPFYTGTDYVLPINFSVFWGSTTAHWFGLVVMYQAVQ